jgi:hypothetical protein
VQQPDELIAELIATGTMNADTLADLERMRAEYQAGNLHPDDEAYLRALHARITNAPMPEPEERTAEPLRLDGLTIAEWRERALAAESELAALRDQQTSDAAGSA